MFVFVTNCNVYRIVYLLSQATFVCFLCGGASREKYSYVVVSRVVRFESPVLPVLFVGPAARHRPETDVLAISSFNVEGHKRYISWGEAMVLPRELQTPELNVWFVMVRFSQTPERDLVRLMVAWRCCAIVQQPESIDSKTIVVRL